MAALNIQEVAAKTGCNPHTLRYYERIDILPHVHRDGGGRRAYSEEDLDWVEFVVCLRETGMHIAEMKRYVDLVRLSERTAPERLALLEAHRTDVAARLASLQRNVDYLDRKIARYRQALSARKASTREEGAR